MSSSLLETVDELLLEAYDEQEKRRDQEEYNAILNLDVLDSPYLDVALQQAGKTSRLSKRKKARKTKSKRSLWREPPEPNKKLKTLVREPGRGCCAKHCWYYFKDDWPKWRDDILYDKSLEPAIMLEKLKDHRKNTFLPGKGAAGDRNYCTKFLYYWTGFSNSKFYPNRRYGPPKLFRKSVIDISVASWFLHLKLTLDRMPVCMCRLVDVRDVPNVCLLLQDEERKWQIPVATKKEVWKWYMVDVDRWPLVYGKASREWFLTVWRDHCSEVVLRRHNRFTKCDTCEKHRAIRWDKTKSTAERAEAEKKLMEHYKLVNN